MDKAVPQHEALLKFSLGSRETIAFVKDNVGVDADHENIANQIYYKVLRLEQFSQQSLSYG